MKAMIFAAGLGTRLKPLTDTIPKALVPVQGKTLLEHVLRRVAGAGISEAVVNVHHFADKVEDWLDSQDWICRNSDEMTEGRMLVQTSDERKALLETGGAVLHARPYLEGCGNFLIHNVDILSDCDLQWFTSQVRPGALATLLVSGRKSTRYLLFNPETMRLEGWINERTGQVRLAGPYVDMEKCLKLAFSGIHIMSDEVLDVMQRYVVTHGIDADAPRFSVIDFYLDMCHLYNIYGVHADNLNLVDVGKLDTLAEVQNLKF